MNRAAHTRVALPRRLAAMLVSFTLVLGMLGADIATAAQVQKTMPAPGSSPAAVVTRLHGTLVRVMKQAKQLGYAGRYKTLQPVIFESFDFPAIARTVLAAHWSSLDSTQRAHFLDTFRRLTVATYASRFNGYAGQRFEIDGVRDGVRGRKVVQSRLVGPGDEIHHFDYVAHAVDGHWRILNVVVDGVSDLALKRSQYDSVITQHGFAGLMQTLDRKLSRDGEH